MFDMHEHIHVSRCACNKFDCLKKTENEHVRKVVKPFETHFINVAPAFPDTELDPYGRDPSSYLFLSIQSTNRPT